MLCAAMLLPHLIEPGDAEALRFAGRSLSYRQLGRAATALAAKLEGGQRVAVWATPTLETCVGVVASLLAGAPVIPVNPKIGPRELEHVIGDSVPGAIIARPQDDLPEALGPLPRLVPDFGTTGAPIPPEPEPEAPAIVFYTSGTTGPPKGVVLPRRALASNLDALAEAWSWTGEDVLTHGLPLFHVHGLVLGILGPLRLGGSLRHVGRFSPEAVTQELAQGATMLFGVPTMYHALAERAEADPEAASTLSGARLLVSGSAQLPVREYNRIERTTGQRIVERYGLTETIINCSTRADGERRAGSVGPSLPGVHVRLVDEAGRSIESSDEMTMGEVAVRGPNLFLEYLNLPEATAAAVRDGWFHTGDLATRSRDGFLRLVGRRVTDLIKTGGFKVGAGEVEAALLEHPDVVEAAVTGEPDERLGQRIVAWVVARPGSAASPDELEDHVAGLLAPHKRPRDVRFIRALPRNAMGKVLKSSLRVTHG
jgi:malonyl-CoA/methylmalonyl-CoA synthetase